MHKEELIKRLLQKGQDYSQQLYLVGFFVIFIFLILFVVRPAINEYVVRNKQLEETIQISAQYQKAITNLNTLQALLEANRGDFGLLDDAIPENINMYQLTQDVSNSFLRYIPTKSFSFPGYVVAKEEDSKETKGKAELKQYKILVSVSGTYATVRDILANVMNQRRVKSVKTLHFARPSGAASGSANLDMKLEIEAFYL